MSAKEKAKTYAEKTWPKELENASHERTLSQTDYLIGYTGGVRDLVDFIKKQKDCPPEFIDVVNKHFWEILA